MASTSNPDAIGEAGEENEAAAAETTGTGSQLVMPEDGYQWKKYGQKFIKNIQKIRSYFRCRHKLCGAKKKVEWHPNDAGGDVRIVYEGTHQHGSPLSASGGQQGAAAPPTSTSWAPSTSAGRGRDRIDAPAPSECNGAPPWPCHQQVPVDALRRCEMMFTGR